MHYIICTIIITFVTCSSLSLHGSQIESETKQDRTYIAIRGIQDGFKLYKLGDPAAKSIFYGAYLILEKHDPDWTCLDPMYQNMLKKAIIKTQLTSEPPIPNNIKRATTFALKFPKGSPIITDTAMNIMHIASRAQEQKNHILEEVCNKKAFSLFEQERFYDPLAKRHYDKLLCYGIGCEYNPTNALPYYVDQLKRINHYLVLTDKTREECNTLLNYVDYFAQNGDMRSQCILTKAYLTGEYHRAISHAKVLDYCEQFVLKLAALPSLDQLPLEYFIIPLTLKQLSFSNKKACLLNTFYNVLYATKKDTYNNKINAICSKLSKETLLSPLVKLLCTDGQDFLINLDKIKAIKLDNKAFQTFCNSDEYAITILFLEQRLARFTEEQQNLADAYHYIIGLCAYHRKEYSKAHTHLTQCLAYANDLYTQTLIFTMSSFENRLALLEETIMPLLEIAKQCPQPRTRDEKAKQLIATTLNSVYEKDIRLLLRNQKYSRAYQFTYYLAQFDQTIKAACDSFIAIERWAGQESEENQFKLLRIIYRSKLCKKLEEKVQEKDHCSSLCDCLHFIAMKQAEYPWTDEISKVTAKKQRLSYLSCALNHADMPDTHKENVPIICRHLACEIGIIEQSISYLDEAIKYGNDRAYYEKAKLLLSHDPSTKKYSQEICDLLEMHSKTDDPLKSESCALLVELLQAKPEVSLEYEKKYVVALQNAVELGHYNYAIDLAQYCRDGIKDDKGEYFLQPNMEQALHYLTLHIEQANHSYKKPKAFMIRGLLYCEKNKEDHVRNDLSTSLVYKARALKDFEESLKYEMASHMQARLILYSGMLTMLIDNYEGVNEHALSHFIIANDILNDLIRFHPENREYYVNIISSCLDDEALDMARRTTLHIMETHITSQGALQWCAILGHFLLQKAHEGICYGREINLAYKNHALEIIKYAARNKCLEAQWKLVNMEGEISLYQKMIYVMNVLQVGKESNNPLVPEFEKKLQEVCIESEWQVINTDEVTLDQKIKYAEDVLKTYGDCDYHLIPKIHQKLTELYIQRITQSPAHDIKFIQIEHPVVEKKEETGSELFKKLESHKFFKRLVQNPTSCCSNNKKYQKAMNIYISKPTQAVIILQQLTKNDHPHAQLHLARHFFESNNALAQTHFENSLRAGIIEEKNQSSRFIDSIMLLRLDAFIKILLQVDALNGARWIENMRTILVTKKIDLPVFQQTLKDLYEYDITQNPGWQKKNNSKKK